MSESNEIDHSNETETESELNENDDNNSNYKLCCLHDEKYGKCGPFTSNRQTRNVSASILIYFYFADMVIFL